MCKLGGDEAGKLSDDGVDKMSWWCWAYTHMGRREDEKFTCQWAGGG